jgi:hypothetical protein
MAVLARHIAAVTEIDLENLDIQRPKRFSIDGPEFLFKLHGGHAIRVPSLFLHRGSYHTRWNECYIDVRSTALCAWMVWISDAPPRIAEAA